MKRPTGARSQAVRRLAALLLVLAAAACSSLRADSETEGWTREDDRTSSLVTDGLEVTARLRYDETRHAQLRIEFVNVTQVPVALRFVGGGRVAAASDYDPATMERRVLSAGDRIAILPAGATESGLCVPIPGPPPTIHERYNFDVVLLADGDESAPLAEGDRFFLDVLVEWPGTAAVTLPLRFVVVREDETLAVVGENIGKGVLLVLLLPIAIPVVIYLAVSGNGC